MPCIDDDGRLRKTGDRSTFGGVISLCAEDGTWIPDPDQGIVRDAADAADDESAADPDA